MPITISRPDSADDPRKNRLILANDLDDFIVMICDDWHRADELALALVKNLKTFAIPNQERN